MANDGSEAVAASIQGKFGSLPETFSNHCIYRVPQHWRRGKETCYKPYLLPIGPIYQCPSLQAMEQYKLRFLRCFLEHGSKASNSYSLKHYIDLIRDRESRIRECYEQKQKVSAIPSNKFTEMVLLDAAFIIYFICMGNPVIPCGGYPFIENLRPLYPEIIRDLFLEENQLPFFVLEDIFQEAFKCFNDSIHSPSFREIASNYLCNGSFPVPGNASAENGIARIRIAKASKVEHLVDMLWIYCLPTNLRTVRTQRDNRTENLQFPPSISHLTAAGVKLAASKTKSMLDVTFTNGVLEMPILELGDDSESMFRSIVLFEQRHYSYDTYLVDYAYFLDMLIDTADDVHILTQAGILKNWLGTDQAVADLFNGIGKYSSVGSYFYYADVCKDLKAFASVKTNRWKVILRRNYFNHPWAIISVIYAVVLLILTAVQTIASFTNYNN